MPLGLAFWILMLLWLVVVLLGLFPTIGIPHYVNPVLLFLLFLILGWHSFGSPLK
jgi:hypothetical protein